MKNFDNKITEGHIFKTQITEDNGRSAVLSVTIDEGRVTEIRKIYSGAGYDIMWLNTEHTLPLLKDFISGILGKTLPYDLYSMIVKHATMEGLPSLSEMRSTILNSEISKIDSQISALQHKRERLYTEISSL